MQPDVTMQRITNYVHLRVHSWLKRKPQHFNGGGNFDVFVTNDEI